MITLLLKLNCLLGLHRPVYKDRLKGFWRPHFVCKDCKKWLKG